MNHIPTCRIEPLEFVAFEFDFISVEAARVDAINRPRPIAIRLLIEADTVCRILVLPSVSGLQQNANLLRVWRPDTKSTAAVLKCRSEMFHIFNLLGSQRYCDQGELGGPASATNYKHDAQASEKTSANHSLARRGKHPQINRWRVGENIRKSLAGASGKTSADHSLARRACMRVNSLQRPRLRTPQPGFQNRLYAGQFVPARLKPQLPANQLRRR